MRDQRRSPLASVGLHATLIVASAVAVFPPLWLLVTSFKPKSEAFSTDVVKSPTLDNYHHVLADTKFLTWFGNSLFVVLITTLLGVFVAATTGYAVSRFRFPFGTFWRLVVPLAKPGLAVTAFYTFITAWAEVAYASAFMTGEENLTLSAGLQTFVNQYTSDWGSMTAAAVLIAIPATLVFSWAQRHLVAGLTAGATKS
ncbi:ABC transporter permease subunit [Streptomyces sp. MCAF7]